MTEKQTVPDGQVFVGCRIPTSWADAIDSFQQTKNGGAALAAFYRQGIKDRLIAVGLMKSDAA